MPDPLPLPITVGNLPNGYCRLSAQQELNTFVGLMQVQLPINYAVWNYGNSTPSADQRGYPWARLNVDGSFDRVYVYFNGSWVSPHSIPASSPVRYFYLDTLASITNYDGGSVGAITATTGPMWEVDTAMQGRMPIGVSGDFLEGTTGGAKEITLTEAQLAAHTHGLTFPTTGTGGLRTLINQASNPTPTETIISDSTGDGDPINVMNPYKTGYFIKRTARIYYTA